MSNNLLSKESLAEVPVTAQLYVVYNNRDYRASINALLSLVTLARLQLDRVNNTSDLEKPISTATQAALNLRPLASDVPTLEQHQALAAALQDRVTQAQLDTAINQITTALQGYATTAALNEALSTALTPISAAVAAVTQGLADALGRIDALEQNAASFVTSTALNTALSQQNQTWTQNFNALSGGVSTSLQSFELQLTTLTTALNDLAVTLNNKADKPILPGDVEGLDAYILDLVGELGGGNVFADDGEW